MMYLPPSPIDMMEQSAGTCREVDRRVGGVKTTAFAPDDPVLLQEHEVKAVEGLVELRQRQLGSSQVAEIFPAFDRLLDRGMAG